MRVERRQDLANISNELLLGTAEVDHTHSRSRVDKVNGRRRVIKPVVVVGSGGGITMVPSSSLSS